MFTFGDNNNNKMNGTWALGMRDGSIVKCEAF